ncbi:pentapeptide repeat-containing protein [Saccharopolyspora sp. NFXS83]
MSFHASSCSVKKADFTGANFYESASFESCTFSSDVSFSGAKFHPASC